MIDRTDLTDRVKTALRNVLSLKNAAVEKPNKVLTSRLGEKQSKSLLEKPQRDKSQAEVLRRSL